MRRVCAVIVVLLCLGSLARANITIPTVPVGDPGNAADTRIMDDYTTGYGSVGYSYNIGKCEVTAAQYTAFLNAVAATDTYGLYDTNMDTAVYSYGCNIKRSGSSGTYTYSVAADWANRPVNVVSYWDSCRFANWLHNGQPTGPQNASTTEDGAYLISGYNGADGHTIQRKSGWKWAVTSEDEWYKAAYYKGGSTNAYWDYPTQSNTVPGRDMADVSGNNANYYATGYLIGSPYYRTEVGEFQNSDSAYGTFDQGGNVWEWNEAIVDQGANHTYRGLRGGSFGYYDVHYLQSTGRNDYAPVIVGSSIGFRVSEVVPEPSSLLVLGSGILVFAGMIRRKRIA